MFPKQIFSTSVLVVATVSIGLSTTADAQTRIFDAEDFVQSTKRGVAANNMSAGDYAALSLGTSWWYNWGTSPNTSVAPGTTGMDYVPTVWNDNQQTLASLAAYLAAGNRPRQILAINEPNLRDQAFMTPEQSADLYRRVKAIADPYGIPVSGPQMAAGTAAQDSITAPDPDTGQPVTYTYMKPFVEDFLHFTDAAGTQVDSIGYHFYGNRDDFDFLLNDAKDVNNGRPVWVTEFNWSAAPDEVAAVDYMIKVVDQMENDPEVEAYAWFKERGAGPTYDLLNGNSGELSLLGWTYVNLATHDEDVWYRPNGKLQAERYVDSYAMSIGATGDTDGFADLVSLEPNAILDYNIFSEDGGVFDVNIRVAGEAGLIRILDANGSLLTSVYADAGGWRTLTLSDLELNPGFSELRLTFQNPGQLANWMEFSPIPEPTSLTLLSLGGLALRRRARRPAPRNA